MNSENHFIFCLKQASLEEGSAEILACVELESRSQNEVLLGMLSVNPLVQNKGFGAKLISFAEEFARTELKAQIIVMKVISIRSELIAYYERKAYVLKAQFENFPYGNEKFGLPKRTDLRFVRMEKTL